MQAFPVSYGFSKFVQYKIEKDATSVIRMVAPIVTLEELYDGFGVDAETKDIMMRTDNLTRRYNHQTYLMNLVGFDTTGPVPVKLEASLPRKYETLTAGSVFAPIFKFTQEWSIVHYMAEKVLPLISRSAISGVFPWIPDLIREEGYKFGKDEKNRDFHRRYGIGLRDRSKTDSCIKAAMKAPKNIPLVPSALRDAIRLGDKLYTQYRLLKDRPVRTFDSETHVILLPHVDDKYVPQSIKNGIDEMKEVMRNPTLGYGESE